MLKVWFNIDYKVAVTGYKGFIGNSLISSYPQGIEIDFLDVPKNSLIIHLAASAQNDFEVFRKNLTLDNFICANAINKNHRLIYASSNNAYPLAKACNSRTLVKANDYYSLSKINGEFLIRDIFKLNAIAIRIPDVFGKRPEIR